MKDIKKSQRRKPIIYIVDSSIGITGAFVCARNEAKLLRDEIDTVIVLSSSTQIKKEDVDQSIKLGLNHPMGPLELSDFIGLDTIYHIANAMYEEFRDPMFASPMLLKKMVTAGQLGRKTGKGFYDYEQKAE